ncbi:MAG: dihydrofolate reductase [Candidatus Peregrinibacteria bacterium]
MIVSLIVAASENNVIGRENDLPWSLPDDLKFFREKTRGAPVIMGRKNFESIIRRNGRALPGRTNIVVTRQADWKHEGCVAVRSIEEAIERARQETREEIFIIGGGEIYRLAMSIANRIYLTRVHAEVPGDVFFPEISSDEWKEVSRQDHAKDDRHPYPFTFLTYERRRKKQ